MANAGQLDQRITFQASTGVSDGAGGITTGWSDFAATPTVWAAVKAKSGGEAFADDRTNATATYSFTIRNRSDIDERHRIVWGGEAYNIRNVLRIGGRELFLVIEAERGVA